MRTFNLSRAVSMLLSCLSFTSIRLSLMRIWTSFVGWEKPKKCHKMKFNRIKTFLHCVWVVVWGMEIRSKSFMKLVQTQSLVPWLLLQFPFRGKSTPCQIFWTYLSSSSFQFLLCGVPKGKATFFPASNEISFTIHHFLSKPNQSRPSYFLILDNHCVQNVKWINEYNANAGPLSLIVGVLLILDVNWRQPLF